MVGHMSVLDVEATCLGISKETFNPPSLPIEAERIHGRRDISDHQNQFITFDLLSLEAQWAPGGVGHAGYPALPFSPASVFALEELTELKSLLIIGFNVHVLAQANNKWNSLFNKIVYPFIADKFPVIPTCT